MKKRARKSGLEVGVIQARIAAAKVMFDRERRAREPFARALALVDPYGINLSSMIAPLPTMAWDKQTVPLSYRYAVWLQAQATGEPPVIRYPRNAAGDESFAPTIEELLLRVWVESGAVKAWQQAVFDLCGFGAACTWYGFHANIVDAATAEGAAEGVEETVARALQGDVAPAPGQDNAMASKALDAAASDTINRIAMPLDAQFALAQAATEQDVAGLEAAKEPRAPSVQSREIWSKRLLVGKQVLWDNTVADLSEASWMARRIVMTMEQAKRFKGFGPGVRSRIEGERVTNREGVEPVRAVNGDILDDDENKRFCFWEYWDKEWGTVHYVHETMAEFLEASEDYPFPDPITGEPSIPGFFPASVCAPIQHSLDLPERTLGQPLIAAGYPLQEEIERLHRFAIASVKRHSVRMYEVPDDLDEDTTAKLEEGIDGALIRRKAGIEPGDMARPIVFQGEAYKIIDLINRLTGEWAMLVGMPMADLTSQPQADTATAEQISVSAGRNQADFVMRKIEEAMAHGVEIERAMLKIGLYPPEKIAGLLGPGSEAVMAGWQASSLDGDHITLKSATRAKAEQVVRVKQLGDALNLTVSYVDPKTGLPVYDASPIVEEILMALDVGRPKRIAWTPEDLMMRSMLAGGGAPGGDGGGGGGGPPTRGKGERERGEGPTDAAHEGAAARRVGV